MNTAALVAANGARWSRAKPTRSFTPTAKSLVTAKSRYQSVEGRTGVPWFVIAVIHERESSQNWLANLAQGDPWNRVSVHVPAGRGPFQSWEDAAVDALDDGAPYLARNKDWSIGETLTRLEEYNGLGYAARGVPSPYVWSGTDQYKSGKYIRDGVYDSTAVDSQPGCAGLLLAMMALDRTISFDGKMPPIVVVPKDSDKDSDKASHLSSPDRSKPLPPSITNPSKGSIGAFIASIFSTIFNSKRK
jgi:lysozyme family protein